MFSRFILRSVRGLSTNPVAETLLEPVQQQPSRIRAVFVNRVIFRFFGFLTGVTTACLGGYIYLTEDINEASREVQRSVTALSHDVAIISKSLGRMDELERNFTKLQEDSAKTQDLFQLRQDLDAEKSLMETSLSKHKAAVWEAQEEIFKAINRTSKT